MPNPLKERLFLLNSSGLRILSPPFHQLILLYVYSLLRAYLPPFLGQLSHFYAIYQIPIRGVTFQIIHSIMIHYHHIIFLTILTNHYILLTFPYSVHLLLNMVHL